MKKLLILLSLILFGLSVNADGITLTGEARFDWVDMSQIQRDSTIDYYHNLLFADNNTQNFTRSEFKQKFSQSLRDKDYVSHYNKAKNDIKETQDLNICAFYYKKDLLIIYAIQHKNHPQNVFYYNPYGVLKYVDVISDNYPNYPYSSKQYRSDGKLISAIYFISKDMQYMYEPDGKFKGLWYQDKMYDRSGKQTVKRTNWGI